MSDEFDGLIEQLTEIRDEYGRRMVACHKQGKDEERKRAARRLKDACYCGTRRPSRTELCQMCLAAHLIEKE